MEHAPIYALINDVAKEKLGTKAIAVKDTTTFISLGKVVLSTDENTDLFFGGLFDRVGKTIWDALRSYKGKNRFVRRNDIEWGAVVAKTKIKTKQDATANPTYDATQSHSPYDVEAKSEFVQKLYGDKIPSFTYEDVIPTVQIYSAFTSEAEFLALISMIQLNISNKLEIDMEGLDALAICTLAAKVFKDGKGTQKRNILKEYNELTGAALTNDNFRFDKGYLKYRVQQMANAKEFLKSMSEHFNTETDLPTFTPEDKLVVEVLTEAASDIQYHMSADTFHNEIVSLPKYVSVPYWQASGLNNTYTAHSKIMIKNDDIDEEEITINGVFAIMRDEDAVASIIDRPYTWSVFNPRDRRTSYGVQADKSFMVDSSENCIIFYDDADEE